MIPHGALELHLYDVFSRATHGLQVVGRWWAQTAVTWEKLSQRAKAKVGPEQEHGRSMKRTRSTGRNRCREKVETNRS